MGSAFSDKTNENNPNNVMIAPNLSGFNRVILSLPDGLCIEDILTDLVENDYLNGVEEHDKIEDDHFVIKRVDEAEVNAMVNYINNKFGYIAHKGYVKPSRNIVIDNGITTTNIAKSTHIALIASPIGKNPNEQFSAYRREYDPESEFPKFERVDIEETIHFTRPEDMVNKKGFDPNNQRNQALDAMTKGVQFDVTETQVVKDREAVKIDYVEKARKLRMEMNHSKLKKFKKSKVRKRICEQFKYDHMNQLIELKRKKYGINRAKRIYQIQREERLKIAKMKQEIDPYRKPNAYTKHQHKFWENFDYSTK
eukprot:452697_1